MCHTDRTSKLILLVIALFLGLIALRPYVDPADKVLAQAAKFDHVYIVSSMFLYKGSDGLLLLDRRNGDIWFLPKATDIAHNVTFKDPMFIVRVPLEKLDQVPR
jgi:hypothetical protein